MAVAASLIARDVTVTIGRTTVLDRVEVTVASGHRYGLVGPNGVGKSTLLRALAGLIRPDAGTIERHPRAATVGLLDQEAERRPTETVRGYLARRTGVAAAARELEATTVALAGSGPIAAVAAERYDAALHAWLRLGGADHDVRVDEMLTLLGLPPRAARPVDGHVVRWSGGEGLPGRAAPQRPRPPVAG